VTDNEDEYLNIANKFFSDLFTKDPNVKPSSLLELIKPADSDQMNEALLADLSEDEIGDTLFQIGPLKAPGPDGLLTRFFQ
jgi:hypothetical protein